MRRKADQALDAWNGDRPSLGDRVDATRAAQDAAAEVMAAAQPSGDEAPHEPAPEPPPGRPMPPEGSTGSWVWVHHPDGAGILCARAVGWTRVTPDELSPEGWAMQVVAPRWVAMSAWTGQGGVHATAVDEGQVVPSSQVEPIPGHYGGAPDADDNQSPE